MARVMIGSPDNGSMTKALNSNSRSAITSCSNANHSNVSATETTQLFFESKANANGGPVKPQDVENADPPDSVGEFASAVSSYVLPCHTTIKFENDAGMAGS